VGEIEQRYAALRQVNRRFHPECNAYCRGDVHAEVVWADLGEAELAEHMAAFVAGIVGGEYLAHRPAPEARRRGALAVVTDPDTGQIALQRELTNDVAYLVTWRERVEWASTT
jgi:hypothetical protein